MNFKTTISLVVLAIIVALFFVFTSISGDNSAPAVQVAGKKGTALPIGDNITSSNINKITITKGDNVAVITKKDDNWTQIKPVVFPVESYQITNIIKDATSLRYVEKFLPTKSGSMPSLSAVGLKNPKATMVLTSKKGTAVTIKIGALSIGGRGYVMLKNDKHVYVVPDKLQSDILDSSAKKWRKKSFSAPKASSADMISLRRAKNSVVLSKYKGDWYIGKKDNQRASESSVSSLLSSLGTVYIDKFIADNPKDLSIYGLKNPTLTLTVRKPALDKSANKKGAKSKKASKSKTSKTSSSDKAKTKAKPQIYKLRIGSPASLNANKDKTKYFATFSQSGKGANVVFTIDASSFKDLNKSVNDLRDSKVVVTPKDEVKAITIKRNSKSAIHITKNSGNFEFAKPKPDFKLDNQAAGDLIDQLTGAKADGYAQDYKAKTAPLATVQIQQRGVGGTETLRVYKQAGGKGYVTVRNDEPVGYKVKSDDLSDLFEPILALREKTIIKLKKDNITAVSLKRADGADYNFTKQKPTTQPAGTQSSQASKGKWVLAGNKKFESDDFNDLLGAFANLRIKKWLTSKLTPGSHWIVLTIDSKGAKPITLKMNPENNQAVISGIKGAFVLKDDFAKKLKTEYRNRSLISASLDDISKVEITDQSSKQTLTVSRDSSGNYKLDSEAPEGKKLSQSNIAGVFDTLAGLSAKRFTPDHNFGDIVRTLEVTTKNGDKFQLACYTQSGKKYIQGAGAHLTGKLNGKNLSRWCILSQSDMKKLAKKVLEDK